MWYDKQKNRLWTLRCARRKLFLMYAFVNLARRVIRFALAGALWLHASFVLHFPLPDLSGPATRLHLTTSEAAVFTLLFTFSLLATYGYGRLALDLLYIYFFPFVLLYIAVKWLVLALIAINRFCAAGTPADGKLVLPKVIIETAPTTVEQTKPDKAHAIWQDVWLALTRPLRRFTLLWCLLLLFTTHQHLLQLALGIVAVHVPSPWPAFLFNAPTASAHN